MSFLDRLLGKPLASQEARGEKIGPAAAIPIFGLDALSSAAYGPEAALTLLIPLGAAGLGYMLPVSLSIVALLVIVYLSYRQTMAAYPGGGGSYTVARENLGVGPGLLAAAALMIDYVLTAAVGISAGVGALVSIAPSLQPHTLGLCLGILAVITLVNLRGVKESGTVFLAPTYLFLGSMVLVLGVGVVKALLAGGRPEAVVAPPVGHAVQATMGLWLLLQVFASGCTAMTGVEAVSNGVKAFREPVVPNAQKTLTVIIALLILLLVGIAYLIGAYGIQATVPGTAGYESVLSMLIGAVLGKGWFYYVAMGAILLVLALSANTAFADFPRLTRIIAQDRYLPHGFASTGRRLVYTQGIWVLAGLAALLLTVFGGVTDRLIPLFAVGAFLAFTLSQAGMVVHWWKAGETWSRNVLVNGLGAVATGVTVLVVMVAKFEEGAWMTLLLIPVLMVMMGAVKRHYDRVGAELRAEGPLDVARLEPPIVILPIQGWSRISQKGLRFAMTISKDVRALHITAEEEIDSAFCDAWHRNVVAPAERVGLVAPKLETVHSPYRWVLRPIVEFVLATAAANEGRDIAVVVPELVETKWYQHLLHNQRAAVLKALLLVRGNQRVIVINVPWYLEA